MPKNKHQEIAKKAEPVDPVPVNHPQPQAAALEFYGRNFGLDINGSRNVQVSIDPTELGVSELRLDLPGIKVRILL